MLTAITTDSPVLNSIISRNFGRSRFFILFDEDKNSIEIIPNPFAQTLGGAGIQLAQLLIEKSVDSVITNQLGANPLRLLISAGIKVYQCAGITALNAVDLLAENKLKLVNITAAAQGNKFIKRYGKKNKY